jgi:molybdopterin-guanine dinucleotide biosynthesis protein A
MFHRAILLAGGRSSRMGTDKCKLQLHGEKLLDRGFRILQEALGDSHHVIVSGNHANFFSVVDLRPGQGPIEGLFSCLKGMERPGNVFVTAVDLPFLSVEKVRLLNSYFLEQSKDASKCQYVRFDKSELPFVFRLDDKSYEILKAVREQTINSLRSISVFQKNMVGQILVEEDIRIFKNLNTVRDWHEAQS